MAYESLPHGKTYAVLAAEGIVARAKQVRRAIGHHERPREICDIDSLQILTEDDERRKSSSTTSSANTSSTQS